VALLRAENEVRAAAAKLDGDAKTGAEVVLDSLSAPVRWIARNAGFEGSVIVEKVRGSKGANGFDAAAGDYVDMFKAGVIDPLKVTRSALQNAASIASLVLTTDVLIVEKPEEEPPADEHGHAH
jgi:chaperonin GroEL